MSHQNWDYSDLLRERGFRVTPQRQMILDAICAGDGHTTPEEIYARVRAKAPSVNRATVYRNLDFLCEMRLVVAARIGARMVYEIAGETPHHHLVCRQCDKVEQIGPEVVQALFAKIEREHEFSIDMDHLALFGLCKKCRRAVNRSKHLGV
jgi:Fur family transcriptional regulator, ferric uptake regulator